jgi:hypothetical protein
MHRPADSRTWPPFFGLWWQARFPIPLAALSFGVGF